MTQAEGKEKLYLVRRNCEYSTVIKAASEREAFEKAEEYGCLNMNTSWSLWSAEEIED